jgi:hypothetical protein
MGQSEIWEQRMEKLSEETHWEKAAKTRMGKYLTQGQQTSFLTRLLHHACTPSWM